MFYSQSIPELYGMRVCKYIRCSHEGQVADGETLDAQNAILDDFILKNHLVLVDTFVDEALTARKKYTKRKEFVRLLDGVQRHDFDLIIFTKLDRWFRNIADYHRIQEILEANGVQWKAVTESYDTTTTNGRLHINIRLSVAQDECDRDSDRIKDVFAYKLQKKTYLSGSLPRGLKLDEEKHVIIDEEWKQFALDMFDHFEATNSKRGTLMYLKEKYQLPRLCHDTIVRNLRNPLYKGEYRGIKDFCPALIAPDRFDRIQLLAKRDVRNSRTRTYIFNGLLVCSECNHNLTGQTTIRKKSDGSNVEYRAYRCNQHYSMDCCTRSKSYREEYVEEYMLSHIRPALEGYVAEFEISGTAPAAKNPQAEVQRIKSKLKKLYELFMDDLIEKEMYKAEYNVLQAQLQEATAAAAAPHRNVDDLKHILSSGWEEVYQTFNHQEKAAFWKSFVDRIIVHEDGSMDIIFL